MLGRSCPLSIFIFLFQRSRLSSMFLEIRSYWEFLRIFSLRCSVRVIFWLCGIQNFSSCEMLIQNLIPRVSLQYLLLVIPEIHPFQWSSRAVFPLMFLPMYKVSWLEIMNRLLGRCLGRWPQLVNNRTECSTWVLCNILPGVHEVGKV